MSAHSFLVEAVDAGARLDAWLAACEGLGVSRSHLANLIKGGEVLVNGKRCKAGQKLKANDAITVMLPAPKEVDIKAQDLPLDIVYEDEDVLIVNKQKGMVVHPAAGHEDGTLVNAVMYHCQGRLSSINGELRPGIVHRIDRDTTGLLVVCKNDQAHNALAEQLKAHSITRIYVALVHGNVRADEGTVDAPIGRSRTDRKKQAIDWAGGRHAVTHYKVLERFGDYTLIACRLETGRTHQIRVHMSSIGHPLLGDAVYGPKKCPFQLEGQCLHAKTLGFIHPRTGAYVEFDSAYPAYFQALIEKLRKR